MDPALGPVTKVKYAHFLSLGQEECIHELHIHVLAVGVDPDVVDHPRGIIIEKSRADERAEDDESLRQRVPKSKNYTLEEKDEYDCLKYGVAEERQQLLPAGRASVVLLIFKNLHGFINSR